VDWHLAWSEVGQELSPVHGLKTGTPMEAKSFALRVLAITRGIDLDILRTANQRQEACLYGEFPKGETLHFALTT
jgi:hypothetical protein